MTRILAEAAARANGRRVRPERLRLCTHPGNDSVRLRHPRSVRRTVRFGRRRDQRVAAPCSGVRFPFVRQCSRASFKHAKCCIIESCVSTTFSVDLQWHASRYYRLCDAGLRTYFNARKQRAHAFGNGRQCGTGTCRLTGGGADIASEAEKGR